MTAKNFQGGNLQTYIFLVFPFGTIDRIASDRMGMSMIADRANGDSLSWSEGRQL